MGISDIMERQMKDMKRKLPFRKVVFLILALFLTAGISMRAVTVNAATYVETGQNLRQHHIEENGMAENKRRLLFYNSSGRLIYGSFKYKGYYYTVLLTANVSPVDEAFR